MQARTRDSMLHFVKLKSCQIQIIKQMPNILLAKISAYTVNKCKRKSEILQASESRDYHNKKVLKQELLC